MKNTNKGGGLAKHRAEFITVTCLDWKPLLDDDTHKDIIIDSLRFLTNEERAIIYAFVIMKTHFHLIWQMMGDRMREDVQRDFLKFTSQQILKSLRNTQAPLLAELLVEAKDRKYQVWERNSLPIELRSRKVMSQKLEYIPARTERYVRAGTIIPLRLVYANARRSISTPVHDPIY